MACYPKTKNFQDIYINRFSCRCKNEVSSSQGVMSLLGHVSDIDNQASGRIEKPYMAFV